MEVTTYFLEMRASPVLDLAPPADTEVVANASLDAASYLDIYRRVGEPWLWYERFALGDDALEGLLRQPGASLHLLEHEGQVAGYSEMLQRGAETQLLYFGLAPAYIGRGLGRFFLDWTIERAFRAPIDRLWVHTCSLDHPRALPTYHRAGFREYHRESGWVRIPQDALDRRSRRLGR